MATRRRLKSLEDVRRYLANLINRTEAGEVEPGTAGKLGYLASILTRVIEGSDVERRLDILESKLLEAKDDFINKSSVNKARKIY
jgi:hypothetical protein